MTLIAFASALAWFHGQWTLAEALSAACLLVLILSRREYLIDEMTITQRAVWLSRLSKTMPWSDVRGVTAIIDESGESTPSLLFEFTKGKPWEMTVPSPAELKALICKAQEKGVSTSEKRF